MSEFNFIQSQNAYGSKFFQFPQVLLYGEEYKELSDSAKLGYMVLRDRLEYSLQNNWIDEENRVYFIFTNKELNDLFGWSRTKIAKVKKELESAGLLYQVNLGFDPKKKKNLPNRLYLADLEVTAKDVYRKHNTTLNIVESLDTSGSHEIGHRQVSAKTFDTGGSHEIGHRQITAKSLDTSGSHEIGHNLDYTTLDTNIDTNIDTAKLDFSSKNFSQSEIKKQNEDLVSNAYKYLTGENVDNSMPFEPETIQLISYWVRTPEQMRSFIGIILNARKDIQADIEKQTGRPVTIIMDTEPELQKGITTTLRRYFNSMRNTDNKNKKINSPENYLYISMKNYFGYWYNSVMAKRNKEASN